MNFFEQLFNDEDFDVLRNQTRWNGSSHIKQENIAEHTFYVTYFTRLLLELLCKKEETIEILKFKQKTIDHAIFHDFDETISFDVNHNLKYNEINGFDLRRLIDWFVEEKIKDKFSSNNDIENFNRKNILGLDLSGTSKLLVKICDILSFIYFLIRELKMGNKTVSKTYYHCLLIFKERLNVLSEHLKLNLKNKTNLHLCDIVSPDYPLIIKELLIMDFYKYV